METFDVIVIGMGAHGSAALWHLSRRSLGDGGDLRTGARLRIAGIDRFNPPHKHGSSHGQTRIIRQAYHENPLYVPLVKAAYPLWAELSGLAGKPLFQKTGGLFLGAKDSIVVSGAKLSAETHGIPFDYLDASAIHKRFPVFRPDPDTVGVFEHDAGILFPEDAITASLKIAAANGATLLTDEQVTKITPLQSGIEITTTRTIYRTEKLIVAAGAWLNTLLPELRLPLTINRQVLFWFGDASAANHASTENHASTASRANAANRASGPAHTVPAHAVPGHHTGPAQMPIFIWENAKGKMFYGFPDLGKGIKIAWHHGGREIDPDQLSQQVTPEEIEEIQKTAAENLTIDPVFRNSCVCMYTNTPDEDFIIDLHPQHPDIVIASPCSGHGFKFSAIIGRLLADLALKGRTDFDLTPFSIHRKSLA